MEGGDEDLEGDEAHPAVVGAARGGQLDHLLHQQIIVEDNLEMIVEMVMVVIKLLLNSVGNLNTFQQLLVDTYVYLM